MPPSTIPSIFNDILSPDPRCENSEPKLPRNGKALLQPHDAWPGFGARCGTSVVAVTKPGCCRLVRLGSIVHSLPQGAAAAEVTSLARAGRAGDRRRLHSI